MENGKDNLERISSGVKNVVAIASGKGGVGKSTVATNLAVALAQKKYKVGLVDADIYGPSIPKMFNVEGTMPKVIESHNKYNITPIVKYGVKLLSIGLFINPDDATVWRGPRASKALQQLIEETNWGDLDYLLFDLPPGTSDIHLTLVQTLPVTGVIIVSTPQDVALVDAIKGINMFKGKQINVPIIGLVENMAWFTPEELPDNKYYIFGKDGCKKISEKYNIPVIGQIPIVQSIREGGDEGIPSVAKSSKIGDVFNELTERVIKNINERNKNIEPTEIVKITKR